MARKRKKTKSNRSRRIVNGIKLTLFLLVLLLPCIWLIRPGEGESEPMRVARGFAHHMIHGEFDQARTLATPQSTDDIDFYATWIGTQVHELVEHDMRFKITHAQQLLPADTTNMVYGKVIIVWPDGESQELHNMELKVIDSIDGWKVDYQAPTTMWN